MEAGTLVALLMFFGASLSDLQTRRVANRYWVPFLVAAVFLAADPLPGRVALLFALGVIGMMYLFWRVHLFGGADAKGLMVVALLTPTAPDLLASRTVLALDTLVNATFMMVGLPLLFLLWNVVRGEVVLPAALLGTRMDLERARRQHYWPMQTVAQGGLAWRYMHRPGTDVDEEFASLRRAGVERVWVTPKIPFMVPLTLGMIAAALWGNLALRAMAALLS